MENESFKRFVGDMVYTITSECVLCSKSQGRKPLFPSR